MASFERDREFAAEACAHPGDRIVVIGHSFGAERAAKVATQAADRGARDVTLIGIDPTVPVEVSGVAHAVNFVGEYRGTIAGAQNIPVPGYSHMGIMDSPAMQERILEEAEAGDESGSALTRQRAARRGTNRPARAITPRHGSPVMVPVMAPIMPQRYSTNHPRAAALLL